MKRFWMISFFAACLSLMPCWAQTFSVAILEDIQGLEAVDLSVEVLGGCLDSLFASGLIATNEAIGRVNAAEFQARGFGISAAREGFVDYIALVWIRYVNHPSIPDVTIPDAVRWRLMRVKDGSILAEGDAPPPVSEKMTLEERKEDLVNLGRSLAGLWAEALGTDRG